MAAVHLHEERAENPVRVSVETRYGLIRGGRAANGCAVFLGMYTDIVHVYYACALFTVSFRA